MSPLQIVLLFLLVLTLVRAERRWALLAMMAGVLFFTQEEPLVILGLNVYAIRFLEVAGFARVLSRREFSFRHLNRIDTAFLALYLFAALVSVLRGMDTVGNMVAGGVDAFLCYFTFRGLVGNSEDFRVFLRALPLLLAPYAVLVLIESQTHHSVFSSFGEVNAEVWSRGGRFRCVGSFRNPDLLGDLGATFLPLYTALLYAPLDRKRSFVGIAFCLFFIWAANSGGPLGAVAVCVLGWILWPMRTRMRAVRWSLVTGFIVLAFAMKAPVWYLPARVSSLTGGDGWHRSYLLDVCFRHLQEWWLMGMPLANTADWFPYLVNAGADITNQFLYFGLSAGIGAVLLLCLLLTRSFSGLGRAMADSRLAIEPDKGSELFLWGLGIMMVVHIVNWFGISYFDQFSVVWFLQLAVVSNVCSSPPVLEAGVLPSEDLTEPLPVETAEERHFV